MSMSVSKEAHLRSCADGKLVIRDIEAQTVSTAALHNLAVGEDRDSICYQHGVLGLEKGALDVCRRNEGRPEAVSHSSELEDEWRYVRWQP